MSLIEAEAESLTDSEPTPIIGENSFQQLFGWEFWEDCAIDSCEYVNTLFGIKIMRSYDDIDESNKALLIPNNMLCCIYKVGATRISTGEVFEVYVSVAAGSLIEESGKAIFEKENTELVIKSGISPEAAIGEYTPYMDFTEVK